MGPTTTAGMTTSWAGDSCAVYAIHNLGQCGPDAKSAMKTFCDSQMVNPESGFKKGGPTFKTLACFYLFIAGPEVPGKCWTKSWMQYGTEFSAFIEENKLGTLVKIGPKINKKHHPDTDAKAWLWSPDDDALKTWYLANFPRTEPVKVAEPVKPGEQVKFEVVGPKIQVPLHYNQITIDPPRYTNQQTDALRKMVEQGVVEKVTLVANGNVDYFGGGNWVYNNAYNKPRAVRKRLKKLVKKVEKNVNLEP